MDLGDIAIATITWARSADDATLLMRSLRCLTRLGVPVVITDRGTDDSFLRSLQTLPCSIEIATSGTLVTQVQQSIARVAALGSRFICYTEPDKETFFHDHLLDFLQRAPGREDVGAVIAARSPDSFLTFPPMQQYAERVMNQLCSATFGVDGDYSYGPFLMHRDLAPAIAKLPQAVGWGWRHATFAAAARRRRRIVHLVGEYECPHEQRAEDESDRAHRIRQLSQNLLGLAESMDGGPLSVPSD